MRTLLKNRSIHYRFAAFGFLLWLGLPAPIGWAAPPIDPDALEIGALPAGKKLVISYEVKVRDPLDNPADATSLASQGALRGVLGAVLFNLNTDDPNTAAAGDATVLRLNNSPVFTEDGPFTIDENLGSGTLTGDVDANDGNGGGVDSVVYSILSGNDDVGGDGNPPFAIDVNTGEITVHDAGDLDREKRASFSLEVQADDGEGYNNIATTTVTIYLNDLNDTAPVIAAGSAAIDENLHDGSFVLTLSATDADATETTFQNWTIIGGNMYNAFTIDSSNGRITVNNEYSLDRESVAGFSLTVTVSDGVNTSAEQTVTIDLKDLNDNVPVIAAGQSAAIDENLHNGSLVMSVSATDADATETTFQDWTITGGNTDNAFVIDGSSGRIAVNNEDGLDRESVASFSLTVTVSDGANTSAEQTVTIDLNDLNDNVPVIAAGQSATIDENLSNDSAVMTLSATDDDATATRRRPRFRIGRSSGAIRKTRLLSTARAVGLQ